MTNLPWVDSANSIKDKVQRVFHEQTPLTTHYDFAGGNQPIYIGETIPGTATSVSLWRIQKRTYSDNKLVKIEWSDGDARFNQIFDNRAALSYS